MRIVSPRLAAGAVMAALVVSAVAGCHSAPVPLPTTAASTVAPVFASDAEALAAAREAYAAYLGASDDSWPAGPTVRKDFLSLSTGQAHEEDLDANQLFLDHGWRKVGTVAFDSMKLQSSGFKEDGTWEVRTYLCVDVTLSDVIDSSGASVAKPDRPLRLPLEVAFDSDENHSSSLLIAESRSWSGSNFC